MITKPQCSQCGSTDLHHDSIRAETACKTCGAVLRQAYPFVGGKRTRAYGMIRSDKKIVTMPYKENEEYG